MAQYLDGIFQALADPTRRAVVGRLGRGPASVGELAAPFDMALPSFMKHIHVLEESGLIPLVAFGDLLQIFFQRFRESVKRGEWKRGIESHQRMLDFLRQNDLPGACDILRRHIESHKLRMEAAR